jgi:hypothetical protein
VPMILAATAAATASAASAQARRTALP